MPVMKRTPAHSAMPHRPTAGQLRQVDQRGAATLIVIMILFFVVTLAAAYASRNLIFEQRTSINQYQSTKSNEAAEAGLEWALTMLNGGRIDDRCTPTTDATMGNFRQRYLNYVDSAGSIRPKQNPSDPMAPLWSACSFDGASWSCSCPQPNGVLLTTLPTGIAAFGVRFVIQPTKPGIVRIEVNGCNSYDIACVTGVLPGTTAESCQSTVCSLVAQFSALRMPPSAAVTARQSVNGTQLTVFNTDEPSGGLTIRSGGAVTMLSPALVLGSLPGTPPELSKRASDAALSSLDADADNCTNCLFSAVFGLRPDTYRNQPAAVVVDCSSACTSSSAGSELGKALAANRGSIIWLKGSGGLALSSTADVVGTTANPVTLVVEGPVSLAAGAKVVGLVYGASVSLSSATIQGALVSGSTVTGAGTAQVTYDPAVLANLQKLNGSFVRVPGSWRDFP